MANEIKFVADTTSLSDLYAIVVHPDGTVRNTAAGSWVAISGNDWGNWDIPLTEQGSSRVYYANAPSGLDDSTRYDIFIFKGSPANGNTYQGQGIYNDGVATLVAAMSTSMKAEVNTEVADVTKTDTITLPGQTAPPLAPTLEQAVAWLYKVFRNRKTQTATQWSLLADNESTVDAKATISDDATTAVKQEVVTGP